MTIVEYSRVVWKHRLLIAILCGFSVLATFLYSLSLPKTYEAKATILMPKESAGGNQVSVSLGGGGGSGGLGSLAGLSLQFSPVLNRDIFMGVLKSRTMREEIMGDLKKTWGASVGSLIDGVEISASKDEAIIAVTVQSRDPKLAAEAANFYFVGLNQKLLTMGTAQMSDQKTLVVQRLEKVSKELEEAENALKQFQLQNKYISMDPQTRGAVDAGAVSRAQLMAAEMELERLRTFATESHPQIVQLKKQMNEMKRQMSKFQYGEPYTLPPENPNSRVPRTEFFVSTARQTELYFQMLRFYRNVKVQEALYTLLIQQLESLKLGESGDIPQVQFLDKAIPPSAPSRPNIPWNVTAAAVTSLILGIFLALFLEYLERVRFFEQLRAN